MSILHVELHYHPDASRRESLRLGSLLFIKSDVSPTRRANVAFYKAGSDVLIEAQGLGESGFFRSAFQDFETYLGFLAHNVFVSDEMTAEEVALGFIATLPQNLRAGKPEPWPPDRVFSQAADDQQPIRVYTLSAK